MGSDSGKKSLFHRNKNDAGSFKLPSEQKRQRKMTSTVDPTRALNEEEPYAISQSKTGDGIRTLQHKDVWGNPIVEPDLSNPTRNRWERPLDTIRSFEAAINRDAKRQSTFIAVDTVDSMDHSQRVVQHNPGPYDSSLFHRNNGAQRYAPVDAYRNSQYRQSGYESRASYSRHPSMSTGSPAIDQVPGFGHANSFGAPPTAQPIPRRNSPGRRYPDSGFQQSVSGSPVAGSGNYDYNSDPASEASSFGSSNNNINNQQQQHSQPQSRDHDYGFSFGENTPALNLKYSQQMDGAGNGGVYGDGQGYQQQPQQQQPQQQQQMGYPQYQPQQPQAPQQQQQQQQQQQPNIIKFSSNKSVAAPPAPAPEEPKKRKGLFKRLSKT